MPQLGLPAHTHNTGKTVLASTVVDAARCVPGASVAFFYCKYGVKERNSFISVTRSILAQALVQNSALLSHFYEAAAQSPDVALSSTNTAKDMLQLALASCSTTMYVIIDGLDECGRADRKEIAVCYQSMVDGLPANAVAR